VLNEQNRIAPRGFREPEAFEERQLVATTARGLAA